jgi:hypothetical protein
MATAMAHDTGGLDDLLGQLDATAARGRQQDMIRSYSGPRIPYMHDLEQVEWRPLPKLNDVRDTLQAGASRKFVRDTKNIGYAFSEPKYLAPKMLDHWTAARALEPTRSYIYPKIAPPRFHSQSEPLPEATDEMLGEQHRAWLDKHKADREHHLYPVASALGKVEAAKKAYEAHAERRRMTTDIITRSPKAGGAIHLGANAKRGLGRAMTMVKTNRAFNQLQGLNPLADAEKRDHKKFMKAKSAPALRFSERPPDSRIEHLRQFQYTSVNVCNRSLRESTPWQHVDEVQDLKNLGRKTW